MNIEEQRRKWKEEKRKQAEDERKRKERGELEEFCKKLKMKEQLRSKGNVFIYNSIVEAFGEAKAKEIRWQSDVRLPLGDPFGDIAVLDNLKFFEYGGTLCLLERDDYMKRIYADYYTPAIIFEVEEELKNEVREDETKQKENLLKIEREERERKRIEAQEQSALQNKESITSWWQNLYTSIKKYF